MHAWSPQNMKELLCNTRLSNVHIFCKRALFKYLVTEKREKKPHSIQEERKREEGKKTHIKAAKKESECICILSNQVLSHTENTKHWSLSGHTPRALPWDTLFSSTESTPLSTQHSMKQDLCLFKKKKKQTQRNNFSWQPDSWHS